MKPWHLVACTVLLSTTLWAPVGRGQTFVAVDEVESAGLDLSIPGIVEVQAAVGGGGLVAEIMLEQSVSGNVIAEDGVSHRSSIEGSFSGGRGIFNVNQDSGNVNNQANVLVVVFAAKDAGIQVLEVDTKIERANNTVVSNDSPREDRLVDSFNDTVGVVGVNQSSGNGNQQSNVLVMGIGLMVGSEAVVLDEQALEMLFPDAPELALLEEAGAPRSDTISGSFQNFSGVAQVTQSSGDLNVLQNTLGVSFVEMGALP
jgi:hypothetical protein